MSPPFSGPRPFSVVRASSGVGAGGGVEVGEVNALVYGTEEREVKAGEVVTKGRVSSIGDVGTRVVDGQPGPEVGTAAAAEVGAAGRRKTNSPGKPELSLFVHPFSSPPPPPMCCRVSVCLAFHRCLTFYFVFLGCFLF